MTMLRITSLLFALLVSWSAGAQIPLTGAGKGAPGGGVTFQGAGDVVSGALAWGSTARAYNAAYANGTNPLADLVDFTTGTVAICTLRVKTTGFADLTGTYCTGSATPSVACAAAAGGSCRVKKLYDQTALTTGWTTATVSQMPVLTFNALNSLPGMTTLTATTVFNGATTITQAQPFTMSGVYERTSSFTTIGNVLSISGGAITFGAGVGASTATVQAGATIAATSSDSAFHAVQGIVTSSVSGTVVVDGAATSGAPGSNAFANPINVGTGNGASAGLSGVIMEVGLWAGVFNATQYGNMNTNQHSAANGYNF